jgi:uncharacterized protein involved in cysteine biosynthesis
MSDHNCDKTKAIDIIDKKIDRLEAKIDILMDFRSSWLGKLSIIVAIFSVVGSGLVSWIIQRKL